MSLSFKKAQSPIFLDILLSFGALALASCGAAYTSRPAPPPAVLTTTASPLATVATTDVVRITSIDGTATPVHANDVYVHAGDIVTLSADSFLAAQNFAPANLPVEAFQWSSTLNPQDICNASQSTDCLLASSFQVNDYGVSYYAPYNMPESVQISVRSARNNEVDSTGAPVADHIIVHNMDFVAGQASAAPVMVVNPANYPSPSLNENTALLGMGRWVTLGSVRYFTPYTYITPGETEWMPYRHGYWAWEETAGWTWISYDPWGWMTDHYGVWRHHATYGWLWLPFENHQYVPHAVTWMDQGESIGWFPYHEPSRQLYVGGFAEGFDDGYWGGSLGVAVGFGQPGYRFHPGFAIVNRRDITNVNIVAVLLNRALVPDAITIGFVSGAYEQKHFFGIPGGTFAGSRGFVDRLALRPAPITVAESIHAKGGAIFIQPRAINPVPQESRAFLKQLPLDGHAVAIGSIARANLGSTHFLPPALGGRGIAFAPIIRDAHGAPVGRLQVAVTHPTQFENRNPIGALRNGAKLEALPVHALPQYDPHAKEAPPIIPQSAPHATRNGEDVPRGSDHVGHGPTLPDAGPAQRPQPESIEPRHTTPSAAPAQHEAPAREAQPLTTPKPSAPARDEAKPATHEQPAPSQPPVVAKPKPTPEPVAKPTPQPTPQPAPRPSRESSPAVPSHREAPVAAPTPRERTGTDGASGRPGVAAEPRASGERECAAGDAQCRRQSH